MARSAEVLIHFFRADKAPKPGDGLNRNDFWSWQLGGDYSAVITLNSLTSLSAKDLGEQAKKLGIPRWRSMKKDELVKVLLKSARQKEREKSKVKTHKKNFEQPATAPSARNSSNDLARSRKRLNKNDFPEPRGPRVQNSALHQTSSSDSTIAKQLRADRIREENQKNLALISSLECEQKPPESDRLVLIVRDAYWVQAYWEITKATVERAKVALENQWHSVQPVLRLLEVQGDGNTNTVESLIDQIPIHGGVKNWFIHLKEPARAYRVAIGYTIADGRFFLICKSNLVCPPATKVQPTDENWTDLTNDVEKYFALSGGYDENIQSGDLQAIFEEKSRHPIHAPAFERLGSGINGHSSEFAFQVDAHMIVYGKTIPNGSVMIAGEPVRLQKDGSFSVKVDMPDRRQVLPIIASSRDGTQQRTTVLAIERNTKIMEPIMNDFED
jgi:uncharacterized protein